MHVVSNACMQALDQAAERLRTKLALAAPVHKPAAVTAAAADVTAPMQRHTASRIRSSSGGHMHSSQQLRASTRTPSPGRRHWIP
jgi:hypothetical protein